MLELPVLELQDSALSAAPVQSGNTGRALYVETYGCQMNLNDTEIVQGIMAGAGYRLANSIEEADVVFLNTCAIRENAERKIHERLKHLRYWRKRKPELVVGVLGCMAERLRRNLLGEQGLVDLVVGPDEYRRLPELVERAFAGEQGIAVKLSRVETYDDITPLRTQGISAWISIMRGCDKFCTFCVVPFTRGRERSRPLESIVREAGQLWEQGFREVTLLGQNVNSYRDPHGQGDFADLLAAVAEAVPRMRIRYTTSHPYDMSDKLIETMAAYENICPYIHLPVQSGSDRILQLMNRHYTVAQYLERIEKIRTTIPGCALSTDIIVGFCTETEEDHQKTMELMEKVRYDGAYMFKYSPRENTKAWKWGDDVPDEVKSRRLEEIIELQNRISWEINQGEIGKVVEVLVEGPSKRDPAQWQGRTPTNKVVIFPHIGTQAGYVVGDLIHVRIERATSATLIGHVVA
ncbi:MAG: tRNA (N6-isopentenyl adenosine(37)-C2)-methylthiotransferase MiaB [Bacteroidota bacterium]|nr:tRNA (N6-isopentenyl adenosine(37)-C2)-methylthiotransferase MiaB [Candidatus Kapabacteria bacterium]MDW8272159.1 tRNA (N6-isopentenyl adenosine(37)-C2)-methylthiotransferase MiaB [Bacteroidota bacterium]